MPSSAVSAVFFESDADRHPDRVRELQSARPRGRREDLGWRFYSDGVGELVPFCSLCVHREFRPDAPASTEADPGGG